MKRSGMKQSQGLGLLPFSSRRFQRTGTLKANASFHYARNDCKYFCPCTYLKITVNAAQKLAQELPDIAIYHCQQGASMPNEITGKS
jgi:hypothetical protein